MFADYRTADGLLKHFTDQIHESVENERSLDGADAIMVAYIRTLDGTVKFARFPILYESDEPPTVNSVMKHMAHVVAKHRLVILAVFIPTMAHTDSQFLDDEDTMMVIFGAGVDAYRDPSVLLNMAKFPIAGSDESGWDVGPTEFYFSTEYDMTADMSPVEIFLEEYHRIWMDKSFFPDPRFN